MRVSPQPAFSALNSLDFHPRRDWPRFYITLSNSIQWLILVCVLQKLFNDRKKCKEKGNQGGAGIPCIYSLRSVNHGYQLELAIQIAIFGYPPLI
jgi:hypothetical protein